MKTSWLLVFGIAGTIGLVSLTSEAAEKKVKYKKTQEVNFENADVQGTVRRPEGMYLVQKKGIDFDPLYKVRESFDRNIKESVDYLR